MVRLSLGQKLATDGDFNQMNKHYHIKKNQEFRKVYQAGVSLANRYMVVYKSNNIRGYNRYGFSVSKKIGNAVIRNRVKRVLREICRLNDVHMLQGFDIVFIARNSIVNQSYQQIEDALIKLLKKVNLYKGRN